MSGIKIEIPQAEAWELAQYIKRMMWEDYRSHAASEAEAYRMRDAFFTLEDKLKAAGIHPR